MSQPTGHPAHCEKYREIINWKTNGFVNKATVEVDIRKKLPRDEIIIGSVHAYIYICILCVIVASKMYPRIQHPFFGPSIRLTVRLAPAK